METSSETKPAASTLDPPSSAGEFRLLAGLMGLMALFSLRRLVGGNAGSLDPFMVVVLPLLAWGVWVERRLVLTMVFAALAACGVFFAYLLVTTPFHPIHAGGAFLAGHQGYALYRHLFRSHPRSDRR